MGISDNKKYCYCNIENNCSAMVKVCSAPAIHKIQENRMDFKQ